MSVEPICAVLSGDNRCEAEGLTATAAAPVLAMCRTLVAAGHDSARPLHAYRGDTLALTVTSIGWGARHAVNNSCGTPSLARFYDRPPGMSAASPIAQIVPAGVLVLSAVPPTLGGLG
jgi:hypothetical protein